MDGTVRTMSSPLNLSYKKHNRVVVVASPELDQDYVHRFDEPLSEDTYNSPRRKLDFDAGSSAPAHELVSNKGSDGNKTGIVENLRGYPNESKEYSGLNNQASIDEISDSGIQRTLKIQSAPNEVLTTLKPQVDQRSIFQKLISRFWYRNNTKTQTQRKWSFNIVPINERIFWESYVEAERQQGLHNVKTPIQIFYYLLNSHIQRFTLAYHHDAWPTDVKEFWLFYFNRTKYIGLGLFSFNLISMTSIFAISYYYSITKTSQFNQYANELRLSFVLYMMGWYLLNLLCLGCYLLFAYFDKLQVWFTERRLLGDDRNTNSTPSKYNTFFHIWVNVGTTILATRCLFFFHVLLTSYLWASDSSASKDGTYQVCVSLYMLPDGMHDFVYLVLIILFEMYQISVISFFPCPWPWILRLCIIECLSTVWRVGSCAYLIGDFPNRDSVIISFCLLFCRFYFVSLSLSNLAFEQKMRSAFSNIQRQHIAADEKMKMINLLCRDIKLPAQQLIQTLTSIDSLLSKAHHYLKRSKLSLDSRGDDKKRMGCTSDVNVDSTPLSLSLYIGQAKLCSSTLNILIDGLLLLNKVEEGRFTMHFQDSLNIVQLTRETLDLISESVSANQIPKSTWYKMCGVNAEAIPPSCSVKSESQSFKLMLYYSFLALLSMACDDNLDGNIDKLFESHFGRNNKLEQSERGVFQLFNLRADFVNKKNKWSWPWMEREKEKMFFMIRLSLDISMSVDLGKRFPPNRGGMFESSCLICHKVATAIGGNWNVSTRDQQMASGYIRYSGQVQIKVPCHIVATEGNCPIDRMIVRADGTVLLDTYLPRDSPTNVLTPRDIDRFPMNHNSNGIFSLDVDSLERRSVRSLIAKKSFVFLKDTSFEPIIMDIFFKMNIKANHLTEIPMLRILTTAEMKIYEVAFVHSIESCLEVRKKGFQGKVILFCERVAYLDEDEKRMCGYVVPLPAGDMDLIHLIQYLYNLGQQKDEKLDESHHKEQRHYTTPHKSESSLSSLAMRMIHKITTWHQNNRTAFLQFEQVTKLRSDSAMEGYLKMIISFIFFDPIVPERRESFTKWRFLSPSGRIIHHTLYFEIADISFLAIFFYQLMKNVIALRIFVFYTCFAALLYCRRFLHFGIMRHIGIRYRTWWNFTNLIYTVGFMIPSCFEFIRAHGVLQGGTISLHPIVKETQHDQATLLTFATSDHGNLSGMQSILSLIIFPAQVRYFVEVFSWPVGYILPLVVCVRGCLIIKLYFSNFFYLTHINLMIFGLCFCTVASLFYQHCLIALSVDSFTTLYDLLLSKDFFDRIVLVGKTTMSLPMQRLQSMQMEVLDMITERALQEKLLLITPLYKQMTTLKLNLILLKELRHHLNVMSQPEIQYFRQQPRSVLISRMKAKLVKVVVDSICAQFVQSISGPSTFIRNGRRISLGSGGDIKIKFVFKLDPALTLVKVDEELFGSMLSFLLRQVIQKIEKYVSFIKARTHSKNVSRFESLDEGEATRFLDHEVLIWIRPTTNLSAVTRSEVAELGIGSKMLGSPGKFTGKNAVGSLFRFTDVRTMLVTLFDTCKPINGSVGQNQPVVAQLSERQESTTGYPLCDRIMKFFDSNVRYEVGNLSSSVSKHYHGYQQVGVPYMLCPDSHRLQRFVEMSNLVGDKMHHVVEKKAFYSRYCNQYDNGLLNVLNGSVSYPVVDKGNYIQKKETDDNSGHKLPAMFRSPSEKSRKPRKTVDSPSVPHCWGENRKIQETNNSVQPPNRKFVGRALLLSYDHRFATELGIDTNSPPFSSWMKACSSTTSHFHTLSWSCKSFMVMYLHEVIFNNQIHEIDCILLDANIKLFVSPSPLIQQHCNALSFDRSGWTIVERQDIIHLLRHVGFTGLIVLLNFPSAFQSSPSEQSSTKLFNPTIHAVKEDISVQFPMTLNDVKYITLTAEKHILSSI